MREGILTSLNNKYYGDEQDLYGASSKVLAAINPNAWVGKEIEDHTAKDKDAYTGHKYRSAVKGVLSPITSNALLYKMSDKNVTQKQKQKLRKDFRKYRIAEALARPFTEAGRAVASCILWKYIIFYY